MKIDAKVSLNLNYYICFKKKKKNANKSTFRELHIGRDDGQGEEGATHPLPFSLDIAKGKGVKTGGLFIFRTTRGNVPRMIYVGLPFDELNDAN